MKIHPCGGGGNGSKLDDMLLVILDLGCIVGAVIFLS